MLLSAAHGDFRRRTAVRRPRTIAAAALAVLAFPVAASAQVVPTQANLDGGSFSEFSQTNASNGTLSLDSSKSYDGTTSAKAVFDGGAVNGYERGIWNVSWAAGDNVWFSAAYYLPVGFKSKMQGEVDLMRTDNWVSHPSDTDWNGVVIYGGDKHARLMKFNMAGTGTKQLSPTFDVPEGRWFQLQVHEKLSATDGNALSETYLDGKLIGSSTAANYYGRPIERVRYGIVAVDGGKQQNPLTLWFDRACVSTSSVAPMAAANPGPGAAQAHGTATRSVAIAHAALVPRHSGARRSARAALAAQVRRAARERRISRHHRHHRHHRQYAARRARA